MIPHARKFPLRTEFLRFRLHAKKTVTSHLIIYSQTTNNPPRLAVTVPKKVSKLATLRNALKRLAYDNLWPQIKEQKIDVVVVFKPLSLKKDLATKQLLLAELHV